MVDPGAHPRPGGLHPLLHPRAGAAGAARYYAGYAGDLVLLTVDPARLAAPLRWDVVDTVSGERFPHVYGTITPDAVRSTRLLHPPHGPGASPAGED